MLTVVTAAAIAGAAQLALKRKLRVGVVVVGEYSIIELRIRVAIMTSSQMMSCSNL